MQRIIIFANGELPNLSKALTILRNDDFVICADGGTRLAHALGFQPRFIIGDMDSTDKEVLKKFQEADVEIELYPRDKSETDLELAMQKAIGLNPTEIIIVAALGGRMDQTIANIALLSNLQHGTFNIKLDDGVEEIFFIQNQGKIQGRSGDIVSLIPWGNPVHGVQTQNLKWHLNNETLYPNKTRGISNEMTSDTASIKTTSGLLLVVHTRNS